MIIQLEVEKYVNYRWAKINAMVVELNCSLASGPGRDASSPGDLGKLQAGSSLNCLERSSVLPSQIVRTLVQAAGEAQSPITQASLLYFSLKSLTKASSTLWHQPPQHPCLQNMGLGIRKSWIAMADLSLVSHETFLNLIFLICKKKKNSRCYLPWVRIQWDAVHSMLLNAWDALHSGRQTFAAIWCTDICVAGLSRDFVLPFPSKTRGTLWSCH